MKNNSKIVIVGGGISGLTTATSLAKRGVNVLLIEKNDKCGGLVNSFTRNGFLFDGGVRAIENAGMIKPMFQLVWSMKLSAWIRRIASTIMRAC